MNLKEENEELKEVLELARSHIVELCTVMNIPLPDATIRRIDAALSQQDANEVASPAQDEREAFEARMVLEGGPASVDLWISGNPDAGYSNERVNDYRFGWVACLEWVKGQQRNKINTGA